jgi:hypothetical protein
MLVTGNSNATLSRDRPRRAEITGLKFLSFPTSTIGASLKVRLQCQTYHLLVQVGRTQLYLCTAGACSHAHFLNRLCHFLGLISLSKNSPPAFPVFVRTQHSLNLCSFHSKREVLGCLTVAASKRQGTRLYLNTTSMDTYD